MNEEKPAKSVSGPFSPEQLKVVSDTSSKLAEALKLKYQETLKQGTLWYQDKLITLSQRTNGGEWWVDLVFVVSWVYLSRSPAMLENS